MSNKTAASISTSRISWIDALKGFTILTVVYLHSYNSYQISGTYIEATIQWITSFHMAAFFAFSGFFFTLPDNTTNLASSLRKKLKALLIPYAIWGILIGFLVVNGRSLIKGLDLNLPEIIVEILIARKSFLASWFLWVLFGVYCVQYLLSAILSKAKQRTTLWIVINVILLCIGYLMSQFFKEPPFRITLILISCFFFMYGALARKVLLTLSEKQLWIKLATALSCLLIGVILCFLNSKVTYSRQEYGNPLLHTVSACLTIFGLVVAFSLLYEVKILGWLKKYLEFMGKNSIIVLLTHSILLYGIRFIETVLGMKLHTFPGLLGFTIIQIALVVVIKLMPKKLLWTFGK